MMIPYPSSSTTVTTINNTSVSEQVDTVGIAIGGTAIGVFSIGAILGLAKYLKRGQKKQEKQEQEPEEKKPSDIVLPVQTDIAYLCVASADLEDIQRILTTFQKGFVIMKVPPI
jgi:hypothetical protein